MTHLDFLLPWRDALKDLVRFRDEDELVAGTLHDTLQCIRINIFFLDIAVEKEFASDYDDDDDGHMYRSCRLRFLIKLREALELVGLALHYDKSAWAWLWSSRSEDPILYETDELEPLFDFVFHDTLMYVRGDSTDQIEDGVKIVVGVEDVDLSPKYYAAKQRLFQHVEAEDVKYQVPFSFVLSPDKHLQDVGGYCNAILDFAKHVRDPTFVDTSCFHFVGMKLYIWRLGVNPWVVALLSELRLAQMHMLEISLRLDTARSCESGKATSLVCGLGPVHYGVPARIIDEISIHESSVDSFVVACTSLMEAQSPERLFLYDAFKGDEVTRDQVWLARVCAFR